MALPKKNTPWIFILTGFMAGTLVGLGLLAGLGVIDLKDLMPGLADRSSLSGRSIVVGKPAPDFELIDVSGEPIKLSDFRDRVVVVNFWATWCLPCRTEMPVLEKAFQENQAEIVVLGVNFQQTKNEIAGFIDPLGISYPILLDPDGMAAQLFQVIQLPNTFFVDRQGIIQFRHIGSINEDQMRDYLYRLGVAE